MRNWVRAVSGSAPRGHDSDYRCCTYHPPFHTLIVLLRAPSGKLPYLEITRVLAYDANAIRPVIERGHQGDESMPTAGEKEFAKLLRDRHVRVTPNRLTVFRAMQKSSEPLTVSELASRVENSGLNTATLYRIMETFTELQITHPVLQDHQNVAYELLEPFARHHDHLVCRQCGKTFDLYDCRLEAALESISDEQGFHIDFHQMELHGLCPNCQKSTPHP
jgi:Fur family ferric uptake transcriptional regulator